MKLLEKLKNLSGLEKREGVLLAKVGSANYNLDNETSDEDYKLYVLPSREDLYAGTRYVKSVTGDVDVAVHDVRDLGKHLLKSNVNFTEVLFSVDFQTEEPELLELHAMREEVARVNLTYLVNSSFGMVKNKMKLLEKGTEQTKHLVETFGYDTKAFMSAYRMLYFMVRYHANGFTSFEKAVRFDADEREFLLEMKKGKYTKEEAFKMLEEMEQKAKAVEEDYLLKEVDTATQEKVEALLKQLVFRKVFP